MRLFASSLALGLAWFAAVNAAATLLLLAARLNPRTLAGGSARRANALLAIRLFPFAAATFVTTVVFLPGHLMLEPESPFAAGERPGAMLVVLAALGAALVTRSAFHLSKVFRVVRQIQTAPGRGVAILDVAAHQGISLAGIVKPRVLIGRGVREALTAAELDVAIAHELAHGRAYDNVTRFILYVAPDLFGASAVGMRLEAEWRAEAECIADARAARGDTGRAAALASALVKVARLADGPRPGQQVIWSTFHEPTLLESRVRRLVSGVQPPAAGSVYGTTLVGAAACAIAVWLFGVPVYLHHATEALIRVLP